MADLSFGDYIRLLEVPENWGALGFGLARTPVIDRLHQIREIRNDVMHFHPDPMELDELNLLRDTVRLLQLLKIQDRKIENPNSPKTG